MIQYLKQYASTHLFYLVIIAVSLLAFRSWREEHDARLLAEQQIKSSDAAVKASAQQIAVLQKQISTNDEKASAQIATLQKLVSAVRTPEQAAKEIPAVEPNLPVAPTLAPDDSISFAKPDVLPLFADLAEAKTCGVKLEQCQSDYAGEQQITSQKDAQLGERDKEIAVLKHPKGFWSRFGSSVKQVGIGVVVGIAIAELHR